MISWRAFARSLGCSCFQTCGFYCMLCCGEAVQDFPVNLGDGSRGPFSKEWFRLVISLWSYESPTPAGHNWLGRYRVSSESVAVYGKWNNPIKSPVEIGLVPAILESFHITVNDYQVTTNHIHYEYMNIVHPIWYGSPGPALGTRGLAARDGSCFSVSRGNPYDLRLTASILNMWKRDDNNRITNFYGAEVPCASFFWIYCDVWIISTSNQKHSVDLKRPPEPLMPPSLKSHDFSPKTAAKVEKTYISSLFPYS